MDSSSSYFPSFSLTSKKLVTLVAELQSPPYLSTNMAPATQNSTTLPPIQSSVDPPTNTNPQFHTYQPWSQFLSTIQSWNQQQINIQPEIHYRSYNQPENQALQQDRYSNQQPSCYHQPPPNPTHQNFNQPVLNSSTPNLEKLDEVDAWMRASLQQQQRMEAMRDGDREFLLKPLESLLELVRFHNPKSLHPLNNQPVMQVSSYPDPVQSPQLNHAISSLDLLSSSMPLANLNIPQPNPSMPSHAYQNSQSPSSNTPFHAHNTAMQIITISSPYPANTTLSPDLTKPNLPSSNLHIPQASSSFLAHTSTELPNIMHSPISNTQPAQTLPQNNMRLPHFDQFLPYPNHITQFIPQKSQYYTNVTSNLQMISPMSGSNSEILQQKESQNICVPASKIANQQRTSLLSLVGLKSGLSQQKEQQQGLNSSIKTKSRKSEVELQVQPPPSSSVKSQPLVQMENPIAKPHLEMKSNVEEMPGNEDLHNPLTPALMLKEFSCCLSIKGRLGPLKLPQ